MLIQFFYRLFRSVGGGAIRICFGYDDANEFSAARTENIYVRTLSPLHNLYPHIGHDAYIFMIVFFIGMRIQLVIMSHICYNENTKRNFVRCA